MGKHKKRVPPDESHLSTLFPTCPSTTDAASPSTPTPTPIIDTHTHLLATFSAYRHTYPAGKYETVWDFVKGVYAPRNVCAIVDVWCEAPVQRVWKEVADSAVSARDRETRWGGVAYWFVMGVHPHDAKLYDDSVERSILEAMAHPRCVGWGEIGLDYHYDNAPRTVQQHVFARQLRHAVQLGKPLTIHTREAEEDTERILKAEVPVDHKIHVHCFTDSPGFACRLLEHFRNLYIGITGVISYATNLNTPALVRQLAEGQPVALCAGTSNLRILLETDAPYMIPSNVYGSLPQLKGRLPLCHTGMIPWTAEFTAGVIGGGWDGVRVMQRANENAQLVYGIRIRETVPAISGLPD